MAHVLMVLFGCLLDCSRTVLLYGVNVPPKEVQIAVETQYVCIRRVEALVHVCHLLQMFQLILDQPGRLLQMPPLLEALETTTVQQYYKTTFAKALLEDMMPPVSDM